MCDDLFLLVCILSMCQMKDFSYLFQEFFFNSLRLPTSLPYHGGFLELIFLK